MSTKPRAERGPENLQIWALGPRNRLPSWFRVLVAEALCRDLRPDSRQGLCKGPPVSGLGFGV